MNQTKMSYEEFKTWLCENVEEELNTSLATNVQVKKIIKNNGAMIDVLSFEGCENFASPLIYLKELYMAYLEDGSTQEIVMTIAHTYLSHLHDFQEMEWLTDFEKVKDYLILRVVNYNKNIAQLAQCPYILKLDLAITFRILVTNSKKTWGTILVTDTMKEAWHVSTRDLYANANENMKRNCTPTVKPIVTLVEQLMSEIGHMDAGGFNAEDSFPACNMQVVSNDLGLSGASTIFFSDILTQMASDYGTDLYVLPSSIHEMIVLPVTDDVDADTLREIVKDVNEDCVAAEERLSDHIYRYLFETKQLIICA